MPKPGSGAGRKRSRGDVVETTLTVCLAALVVIYGGGVIGAVFSGIGQMMAAVISVLMH